MRDLRLIIDLKCNLHCSYCCNELAEVREKFVSKNLQDIDFDAYARISISGGEPFAHKEKLYRALAAIGPDKPVYIYTNGLLYTFDDALKFYGMDNVRCFNLGLHSIGQVKRIPWHLFPSGRLRLHIEDIRLDAFTEHYPWLQLYIIKTWTRNQCAMPNEDWTVML